jgi:hypothetical protein
MFYILRKISVENPWKMLYSTKLVVCSFVLTRLVIL